MTSARAEPFSEPWRVTLTRTVLLALAVGVGAAAYTRRPAALPIATLVALWFTLGGHFMELLYRNTLQPRLGDSRLRLMVARLAWWFAGGSLLYGAALATLAALGKGPLPFPRTSPSSIGHLPSGWWIGGVGFIGAELLIHALLRARRQPSFYDGRG